jgi:hypothetical protein
MVPWAILPSGLIKRHWNFLSLPNVEGSKLYFCSFVIVTLLFVAPRVTDLFDCSVLRKLSAAS